MTTSWQTILEDSILSAIRGKPKIDPRANCFDFDQHYGLTFDGRMFDPIGYAQWVPIYQDTHPAQVLMAGAQTGKTRWALTYFVRSCYEKSGKMLAYYFPDFGLVDGFSSARFAPFMASNQVLAATLGTVREDGTAGANNVRRRSLGESTVFFLSVCGKTSTESFPFVGIFFDEVRRMGQGDIERAEQRTAAQREKFNIKVSTALYPDSDIHAQFMRGDQRWFHSECDCSEGVVLSKCFPNCIQDLRRADAKTVQRVQAAFAADARPYLGLEGQQVEEFAAWHACYVCPRCGKVLTAPNVGWWEADNPGAWVHSWQTPQFLSPTCPAPYVLKQYDEAKDVQEFWNSVVGIPFLDPEAQPVHDEHLEACVDLSLTWSAHMTDRERRHYCVNTAAGMDTMGGYNCLVVKRVNDQGKYETVHVEVLHGTDPWKQAAVRMVEYDVRVMVCDHEPHYNEALRFARTFRGRVFLAHYGEIQGTKGAAPLVQWGDRAKMPADQKGHDSAWKWNVRINKTKGMQWSLGRWVTRRNVTPDPRKLIQRLPVEKTGGTDRVVLSPSLKRGTMAPVPVCLDPYFRHQKCIVFRKDYASEEARKVGDFKVVAENLGLDPHFANANLYADVACARLSGQFMDGEE
jgi:hypothetical protein